MCGIAGYLNLDGKPTAIQGLKAMTDSLAHRGPDGEGQWAEANCAIGHRRLSIIDLSDAAAQPMLSSDGRYVLSYNGEIYNYVDLREELVQLGHKFKSSTDSEVLLYALAEWGPSALYKLNGMFAFALWDRRERRLTLARDRYGIKPLYYASQGTVFFFGSEQKAITASLNFKQTLNREALFEYFTFQNILTDQTLLKDVHLLPHGSYAILEPDRQVFQVHRYWDYHFESPPKRASDAEYKEELQRLMHQAVSRQLVGDVEVGAYLSGGIDSASIVAYASKQTADLKTFTIGFDLQSASGVELSFDERDRAEFAAAHYGTEHYERVLKSGDMEKCLPSLAHHLEEPRVGQSYPNYYAAKLASKFVKVVLSGTGGDELFGGYPWRYFVPENRDVGTNFEEYIDGYYLNWQRLLSNSELRNVFEPIWSDVNSVWTRDIFKSVFANNQNTFASSEDFINHSLYFEAKTFLQGLLIVEDKISMSQGLETRVPFLDNDLVDFAMQLPVDLKVNLSGQHLGTINENDLREKVQTRNQPSTSGKRLLRQSMAEVLPNSFANSPKQGFSSPDASWFRGESLLFVKKILGVKNAPIYDYLSYPVIQGLLEQHMSGTRNRRLLIWSLLNVNAYLESIS